MRVRFRDKCLQDLQILRVLEVSVTTYRFLVRGQQPNRAIIFRLKRNWILHTQFFWSFICFTVCGGGKRYLYFFESWIHAESVGPVLWLYFKKLRYVFGSIAFQSKKNYECDCWVFCLFIFNSSRTPDFEIWIIRNNIFR